MLFKRIKKVHIRCSDCNKLASFTPGKTDHSMYLTSCPELEKALDLAERHNRLMEELTSFYEENDNVYFER